jgi:spore germination cell wall hydrolase CwlJ-like protein
VIDVKAGWEHALMALMIWREARNQVEGAQHGVGFTVLNRVARPGWWGSTIIDVLRKAWQYSSLTDPKDKQLTRWPSDTDPSFIAAWRAAGEVLGGLVTNPVPGADSYYDDSLKDNPPAWAKTAKFVGKIGALNFFNVDHDTELVTVALAAPPIEGGSIEERLRAFLGGAA